MKVGKNIINIDTVLFLIRQPVFIGICETLQTLYMVVMFHKEASLIREVMKIAYKAPFCLDMANDVSVVIRLILPGLYLTCILP